MEGIEVIGLLTDGVDAGCNGVAVEGNVAGRTVDGTAVICAGALGDGIGVTGRTIAGEATTVDRGGVLATQVGAVALAEFEVCALPETLLALTEYV